MSPAASVEFRVPGSFKEQPQPSSSPFCQYPSNPSNPSFSKLECDIGGGVGNRSEQGAGLFHSGPSAAGAGVRPKPRLVKVRKGSAARISRGSSAPKAVDSGFNPFQSVSQSSDQFKAESDRTDGFPTGAKIGASSGESVSCGFAFGGNSSINSNYSKIIGGGLDRTENHRYSGVESLHGVCSSSSGLGFGIRAACNEARVEAGGQGENAELDNTGFVFGNPASMKGKFQNVVHSSFVRGEMGNDQGANSAYPVGTSPLHDQQTSSHMNHVNFIFGEARISKEGGVGAFANNMMKENVKPDSERHGRMGFVLGDNANHLAENDQSGREGSGSFFVFRSGNKGCSTRTSADPKMSEQVNVENSANQGACTTSSFEKPSDVKLADELNNLKINNLQKAVHAENAHFWNATTGAPDKASGTFVFTSIGSSSSSLSSSSSSGMMSTSTKMGKENSGNMKDIGGELNGGASVGLVGDNIFVFGASSSTSAAGASTHSSANNQFSQSSGNSEREFKEDVGPSTFPPFGFGTTPKHEANAVPEEGKRVESVGLGFKGQNAFTFSTDSYKISDRESKHGVKARTGKDTKSKKTKGKARRPNALKQKSQQETQSSRSNIDSPECYSPMDFSPYEESVATEQCPQENNARFNVPFAEVNCAPLGQSPLAANNKGVSSSDAYVDPQSKQFSGVDVAAVNTRTDIHSNASLQQNDGSQVQFTSDSGNQTERFMFTASTSAQAQAFPTKHQYKKKFRRKARVSSLGSTPSLSDKQQLENGAVPSESKSRQKSMTDEGRSTSPLSAAEEACEKWKFRGNQAYKDGELAKAEGFYTWGINCIPSGAVSDLPVKALVLCYSNRAATRMALGRVREALQDCLTAVALDSDFLKAHIRAANCHLMLGELEEAVQNFNKCTMSGGYICLDRQLVISAAEGMQKVQKVAEYIGHVEELLKLKTSEASVSALESIAEAMSISLHSEKLLALKAEALCLLQKYEDAIHLCEKTLVFAEKNFPLASSNDCDVRVWRSRVIAKCYFHLGRLEAALGLLQELGNGRNPQDPDPLVVTTTELLKHKNAGNEAFRSGRHAEALEHYAAAITCSIESRPFAAVCFCNRAAAYQALGQIADAISDCSIAMALDENYVKAISRRANLHEKIRDYKQAAADLQKLVSVLEKQSPGKAKKQSGSGSDKELQQARQQLFSMEERVKKETSLDFYLILGVKQSDTASEVKKAYRKAALKHHPDKAAQSLVRSESGVDGRLWKEIADSVHKDSDRLFKMIGEAYAVLSDPEKRTDYDLKEDMRSASRAGSVNRGAARRESEFYGYTYSYPFERSANRRQWQSSFRSRDSYSRWY